MYYVHVPDHLEEREYLEMVKELKIVKEKFFGSVNDEVRCRKSPNVLKRKMVS